MPDLYLIILPVLPTPRVNKLSAVNELCDITSAVDVSLPGPFAILDVPRVRDLEGWAEWP